MIPYDYITEWRDRAPWVQDVQVEQDLIIARAIVEVFGHPDLRNSLAFRGGTALYKLHLPPVRYSEDIDLVQVDPAPIGPTLDAVRSVLDSWLGEPTRKRSTGTVTLAYRVPSEDTPPLTIRLKIEINTREHFTAFGLLHREYAVESRWFTGAATVATYHLDELLGTKLRALYPVPTSARRGATCSTCGMPARPPAWTPTGSWTPSPGTSRIRTSPSGALTSPPTSQPS